MIQYKIDVLEKLKECGYSTTRIRREHLISEATLTRLRERNTNISCNTLGTLCSMLRCQPGDILENFVSDEEKLKLF